MARGVESEEDGARTLADALATFNAAVTLYEADVYGPYMSEALRRIPRDPSDAPTVALALALGCGIWTADADFCGSGVAVWSSDVLRAHLTGNA